VHRHRGPQRAELDRRRDRGANRVLAHDVGRHEVHPVAADAGFQRLALVFGHVGDDHLGPGRGEPPHGRRAEPAGTAHYQRGCAFKLHVSSLASLSGRILRVVKAR
jgi:hypothetical protein